VCALHTAGILHGDIKPANLLLHFDDKPRLCIADFGGSQRLPPPGRFAPAYLDKGALLRMTFALPTSACTPQYSSPEAFDRPYGLSHDVWSTGTVIYELAGGGHVTHHADKALIIEDFTAISGYVEGSRWKWYALDGSRPEVEVLRRMLVWRPVDRWGLPPDAYMLGGNGLTSFAGRCLIRQHTPLVRTYVSTYPRVVVSRLPWRNLCRDPTIGHPDEGLRHRTGRPWTS